MTGGCGRLLRGFPRFRWMGAQPSPGTGELTGRFWLLRLRALRPFGPRSHRYDIDVKLRSRRKCGEVVRIGRVQLVAVARQ